MGLFFLSSANLDGAFGAPLRGGRRRPASRSKNLTLLLVLLRRRFVLVLMLAELGMGSRFGALRAVAPRGHAGGERSGKE